MARTVSVRLQAEVSGYLAGIKTAARSTKDFVSSLNEAAKQGKLDAVADQAGRMGLALAGAFGGVLAVTAKFDKAMSGVSAATHASGAELEQLRQAALQAGKDTAFSATEAAEGITELSKAGVATADILGGGLAGALDLAAAGELSVGEAAETAASAMTQFKLSGRDLPHVADLLAAGAGKAQGSVHDMAGALNQAGLVASQMGLSIEETTGGLAAFASAGLIGSDAGTSFKTMLQRLAAPAGDAADLMQKLNISAFDTSGNFVGLAQLAGQLQQALGGMTAAQRNATLATLFGSDAIRAASVLYQQGQAGIQDWIDKVNDSGYAAETASRQTDNLVGDLERLKGSLETLAIEAGSGSTSGLRQLVQMADRLVGAVSTIPGPVQTAAVAIAGISGAALLAAAAAIKLRSGMGRALDELAKTGPIGQRAAAGLDRVAKATGRVVVALTAVQVASAALGSGVNPQIDALAKHLAEYGRTGKASGEATRIFGDDLGKLDTALKDVADSGAWSSFARGTAGLIEGFTGLGNVMDDSLQHSKERLQALDQALAQLVQSGHSAEAKAAFDRIAESAAKQGVSVKELNGVLPAYNAAVEMAGTASSTAAGGIDEVGTAAQQAQEEVDKLKEAFDKLFGATIGIDRANVAYKQGLKELKAELEKGKRTLDINTQAGRDNVTAILDQIQKIEDLRQAQIDNGMSVEEANKKYGQHIDSLRKTLRQMGFNEDEVDALIGKYRAIPSRVYTDVVANTKTASNRLSYLHGQIKDMPDKKTIDVVVRLTGETNISRIASQLEKNRRWGGVDVAMAAGGALLPGIYPASNPPLVHFAEPGTGGEAYIPHFGNRARSLEVWRYVGEKWFGMNRALLDAAQAGARHSVAPTPVMSPLQTGARVATASQEAPSFSVQVFVGNREITDIVDMRISEHDRGMRRRVLAGSRR